jgi:hypothetical protein
LKAAHLFIWIEAISKVVLGRSQVFFIQLRRLKMLIPEVSLSDESNGPDSYRENKKDKEIQQMVFLRQLLVFYHD